jgi:membrane protein CcdC involved in cytochrome C biogenesis
MQSTGHFIKLFINNDLQVLDLGGVFFLHSIKIVDWKWLGIFYTAINMDVDLFD